MKRGHESGKNGQKKVTFWRWVASSFLWLLSPSWASSLWEEWTHDEKEGEDEVYPPPPSKD